MLQAVAYFLTAILNALLAYEAFSKAQPIWRAVLHTVLFAMLVGAAAHEIGFLTR